MDIVYKTGTHCTTVYKNRPVEYIVIHYAASVTDRAGTAANTAAFFGSTASASADYIVDMNTVVCYNNDPNRFTWACGKKYGVAPFWGKCTNKNSISIEICSVNKTGKYTNNFSDYYFNQATVDRAVELTKFLMKKYNVDIDHIVTHYQVAAKSCPAVSGWGAIGGSAEWEKFKAKLTSNTSSSTSSSVQTATVVQDKSLSGKYRVNASDGLNMRSGGGANYPVVITLPDKSTVECFGWHTANGNWYAVQAYGKSGYVNSKFLTKL